MDKKNSDNALFNYARKDTETTQTQVFVLPPELIQGLLGNQISGSMEKFHN